MKGWPHGSAIKDGNIRYLSPSALTRADPNTNEGCLRAYFYEYVKKLKPEQQQWQTDGIELHAQNEHYLLTGDKSGMGSLALAGLHMLPRPKVIDDRILIEHEIGGKDLANAPVKASGIPLAGYIDVIQWQEINAGTTDVTETIDPPGTVEVIDWKTTSNEKWIKSPKEVSRTLQMTTYGMWAVQVKKAERVRLSHGYYITKGRNTPRKVSLLVHKDEIQQRWEYVEHLASSLIEVVKETNPDKVPANTRACDAFRGCPHRSYCSAAGYNSLASLFSEDFASSILGIEQQPVLTVPEGNDNVSLLAKLQAQTAPKPDVASEMKRLAEEEIRLKYPAALAAVEKLEKLGLGLPKMAGEAAKMYATLTGKAFETFDGMGELAQLDLVVENPDMFLAIQAEAEEIVKQRTAAGEPVTKVVEVPLDPFPTDAPPALASPPEPKEEPVSTPEAAMEVIAGDKPKKRGRPPKVKEAPAVEPPTVTEEVKTEVTETTTATTETTTATPVVKLITDVPCIDSSGPINLFVDCIPSARYESFWPYVQKVTSDMAKFFGGEDYRVCKDTDYGKWKGFLAIGIRKLKIPAGNYLLDNSMNETASVVVEVMREIVAQSGGMLVKGIR